MKRQGKMNCLILIPIISIFCLFSQPAIATEITIVGEVNDSNQIVTDDQIYEVADTAKGDELVTKYIAERVEVTGILEEKDDMKIITVTSFRVIPE